jgi:hypothetical protein
METVVPWWCQCHCPFVGLVKPENKIPPLKGGAHATKFSMILEIRAPILQRGIRSVRKKKGQFGSRQPRVLNCMFQLRFQRFFSADVLLVPKLTIFACELEACSLPTFLSLAYDKLYVCCTLNKGFNVTSKPLGSCKGSCMTFVTTAFVKALVIDFTFRLIQYTPAKIARGTCAQAPSVS